MKNNKGEKEPISALWIAAGFGLIGALAAVVIEKELIPLHNLLAGSRFSVMLPSFLAVGVIEETLKFLPLAIFIYPKKYFNKHIDGIIYFAIAGLGFGLPENILYTLDYGSKAGLNRLILTPFFHAAITGMVGYFLIKAKLSKKNPLSIWPVLVFAVLVHSLYDFGLSSGTNLFTFISITITLALSTNCLNLFLKAKDLDEDAGLVAVGHNSYCRSCGHNNKAHHLYCTSCGNRA
ncbi:MAG TPA: PrsW family intramembrane metalloprotease [Candidatus Saccharimonadales bacterium]